MSEHSNDFEQFWKAYPLRKDKGHALKAFNKVSEFLPQMLEAIERQQEEREARATARLFVPEWKYPATWLNGHCWEDEVHTNGKKEKPKCGGCPHDPHAPNPCGYCDAISRQNRQRFGCSKLNF